jgi:hypothetical protein
MKKLMVLCIALGATPALTIDSADARVGRPLTPMSVAGVNRRMHRRAYRHNYYGTPYAY